MRPKPLWVTSWSWSRAISIRNPSRYSFLSRAPVIVEVTGVLAYSRLENQLELSTASGPWRLQASSLQTPLFDLEGDVMVGVFFFFVVLLDFDEDLKGRYPVVNTRTSCVSLCLGVRLRGGFDHCAPETNGRVHIRVGGAMPLFLLSSLDGVLLVTGPLFVPEEIYCSSRLLSGKW